MHVLVCRPQLSPFPLSYAFPFCRFPYHVQNPADNALMGALQFGCWV